MSRYAALLRGINVGGHQKVSMADLRALFQDLGFAAVRTLLNSGNVVFSADSEDAAALARRIEDGVADRLGLSVRGLVLTGGQLSGVLEGNPLLGSMTTGSRMMAHLFVEPMADAQLAAHDPTALAPEEVAVGDGVVYQWCPDGLMAAPPVRDFLEKELRTPVTSRNWNTVTKLAAAQATDPTRLR